VDELMARLELIERKLNKLIEINTERDAKKEQWLDSKAFCAAVGIKDKASLHYYMAKGVIRSDALRNIGTAQRPRYRFHRVKAVDQFLNRWGK